MAWDRPQCSQWMDQAAAGDAEAFGLLSSACQDDLYRLALRRGLGWADAAEATQETFARAFAARGRWRRGGDAAAWLRGIAMNVIREVGRHRRRMRTFDADGPEGPVAENADPSEPVSRADELTHLRRAVARLPERQREALCLRFLERMSVRQAAAAMRCAEGTVKASVFAAMENLRKMMKGSR